MNYHLSLKSSNAKTGAIPVSTSSKLTCPDACPMKRNGCYAASGSLNIHWLKISRDERGVSFEEFIKQISFIPLGQLWRHNQAGDLPGVNNKINKKQLFALVKANKGRKGFTYSHKLVIGSEKFVLNNRAYIKYANDNGFTINLSGNSLAHADELKALNIGPVAAIVPFGTPNTFVTPAGNKGVICPAQREGNNTTCEKCQLCQKQRSVIVGFIPHGNSKNKVNQIANS